MLALAVALSHAGVTVAGLNPGVIAVVCFYMISGFVMTGLLTKHYSAFGRIPAFFLDRALRLMPQYLLIAGLTLAWFWWARPTIFFLGHVPSATDLLNNLLVVPLNYYMFNASDTFTLIPPAWSLGAEIQFYLLMPFLLLLRLRLAAFGLALIVYGCALFGVIDSNTWGYRLLPGVLVYFVLGSYLYSLMSRVSNERANVATAAVSKSALTLAFVAVIAAMLAAWGLAHTGKLMLPYNRETLLGIGLGVVMLITLGGMRQRHWDNRLGDWSYGVFLNHFLIQWTFTGVPTSAFGWLLYLGSSIALSALMQSVIERPVLTWRRGLRREAKLKPAAGSTAIAEDIPPPPPQ